MVEHPRIVDLIRLAVLDALTFGRLESPALWLHDRIREVLGE